MRTTTTLATDPNDRRPSLARPRAWITLGAAGLVALCVIAGAGIFRANAAAAYDAASADHASAVEDKSRADLNLDRQRSSGKNLLKGWTDGTIKDLGRVANPDAARDVRLSIQDLRATVDRTAPDPSTRATRTSAQHAEPSTITGMRDGERSLRAGLRKVAAGTSDAKRAAVKVDEASQRVASALQAAAKSLPKREAELLAKYGSAPDSVRAMFSKRIASASAKMTAETVTRASEGLSALRAAHARAERAPAETAAGHPGSTRVDSGRGNPSASAAGSGPSTGQSRAPRSAPTSPGAQSHSTPAQGAPGATSGADTSRPATPGVAPKPPAPAPAPCRISVVPQKIGAAAQPGASGSQSGIVGGCAGPVTVTPAIPSNANFTVSTSGSSWTVRWSVPMPSDW
ncbi:MAG: hypothetical protein V4737_01290 [Curtobacterium sp.]